MIKIISTFNTLTDPRFDCKKCIKATGKKHREEKKACNGGSKVPIAKYHDYFTYYRCPGGFRSSDSLELITLNRLWENGILPYEGGILDQPAKYVEAMRLIDSLKAEHQKDIEAKASRWQKTQSQSNLPSSKTRR